MKKNNRTFTSPEDIKFHIGIMQNMSNCSLRQIRKIELQVFRECLGKAFYDYLMEHLAVYDSCESWCERDEAGEIKLYAINSQVVYKGVIYIALKETSEIPVSEEDWKAAPKFDKDCLEELWCEFLCEYLAWEVFKNRAPYLGIKIGPDGYVKSTGRDFQAASYKDLEFLNRTIDRDVCIAYDNLEDYLLENKDGCFDLFKGNAKGSCGDCGCVDAKCSCSKDCGEAKRTKYKRRVG